MQKLTAQQNNVLAFIKCFISKNSFSPTIQEISTNFEFSSPNAAQCHVNALIKKEAITATPNTSRSIVLVSDGDAWIKMEDKDPDDYSGRCLAYTNDIVSSWVEILYWDNRKGWLINGKEYPAIVTHWMPLPMEPKDINNEA